MGPESKLWNAVICMAINDAIKPFSLVFEEGEDYKKMFSRQYKNFLKRKENPFNMSYKMSTGEPSALTKRKARVWFEAKTNDFENVCYCAGIDVPEKISSEVIAMCALVDEYEQKYKIDILKDVKK